MGVQLEKKMKSNLFRNFIKGLSLDWKRRENVVVVKHGQSWWDNEHVFKINGKDILSTKVDRQIHEGIFPDSKTFLFTYSIDKEMRE